MQNYKEYSKYFERWAIGLAGFVLVTALFFLVGFSEYFFDDDSSNAAVVGEITLIENDVRKKPQDRLTWKAMRNKKTVQEGDSVFTGSQSQVQINLINGGELKVHEQTLVVIFQNDSELLLQLDFGSFSGKLGKNATLVFVDGNGILHQLRSEDAEVNVRVTEENWKIVNIVSGEVDYTYNHGTKRKLIAGDRLEVTDDGRIAGYFSLGVAKALPPEEKQNQPAIIISQFLEPNKPPVRLPSSVAAQMGQPAQKLASKPSKIQPPKPERKLEYTLAAPAILIPKTGQMLMVSQYFVSRLFVTWEPVAGAAFYRVQISKTEDFAEILADTKTPKTATIVIENLPPGEIYIRVHAEEADQYRVSHWTTHRMFVKGSGRQQTQEIEPSLLKKIFDTKKRSPASVDQ